MLPSLLLLLLFRGLGQLSPNRAIEINFSSGSSDHERELLFVPRRRRVQRRPSFFPFPRSTSARPSGFSTLFVSSKVSDEVSYETALLVSQCNYIDIGFQTRHIASHLHSRLNNGRNGSARHNDNATKTKAAKSQHLAQHVGKTNIQPKFIK